MKLDDKKLRDLLAEELTLWQHFTGIWQYDS
jgi:hypothetical protein